MNNENEYKYGFHDANVNVETFDKGLSRETVSRISAIKSEPDWMTKKRLEALDIFYSKPMPTWGGDMSDIDFNNIIYYVKPSEQQEKNWDDVPDEIRNTYDKLGIPQAEQKYLAGVKAQYKAKLFMGAFKKICKSRESSFLVQTKP